jgi:hypothetical protein
MSYLYSTSFLTDKMMANAPYRYFLVAGRFQKGDEYKRKVHKHGTPSRNQKLQSKFYEVL